MKRDIHRLLYIIYLRVYYNTDTNSSDPYNIQYEFEQFRNNINTLGWWIWTLTR